MVENDSKFFSSELKEAQYKLKEGVTILHCFVLCFPTAKRTPNVDLYLHKEYCSVYASILLHCSKKLGLPECVWVEISFWVFTCSLRNKLILIHVSGHKKIMHTATCENALVGSQMTLRMWWLPGSADHFPFLAAFAWSWAASNCSRPWQSQSNKEMRLQNAQNTSTQKIDWFGYTRGEK